MMGILPAENAEGAIVSTTGIAFYVGYTAAYPGKFYLDIETGTYGKYAASVPGYDLTINYGALYFPAPPDLLFFSYFYNSDGTTFAVVLPSTYADNLPVSTSVSSTSPFSASAGGSFLYAYSTKYVTSFGTEFGIATGKGYATGNYIGFKFTHDTYGTYHYGWISIDLSGPYGTAITVTGFGYESVAGTAILTGATAVPEPGSMALAALALGAAGLSSWRRRRREEEEAAA